MTETTNSKPEEARPAADAMRHADAAARKEPAQPHPDDLRHEITVEDYIVDDEPPAPVSDASEEAARAEIEDVEPYYASGTAQADSGQIPDGELDELSQAYPAEKARQGRIILDTPERRALFLGGLVGLGIVALALLLLETV